MKFLERNRMRLMLIGFVAFIVLGDGTAKADFTFGEPTNLGPTVNSSSGDTVGCFSADGLEMYLSSKRPSVSGESGTDNIWVATRETIDDEWGTPVDLGATVNHNRDDGSPCISSDGLELYFTSGRPGGYGGLDIWVAKRATKDDAWKEPQNLGPLVNSYAWDGWSSISSDGLELYFSSDRSGGYGSDDIWISKRATKDDPWGEPVNLGLPINTSDSECWVSMSSDDLTLFFSAELNQPIRPGGYGNSDMWMSRRSGISDPWGTPVNLGPIVNSTYFDCGSRVSYDGYTMYFNSERAGGLGGRRGDIYQASIIPIVDLNGDGIVDSADMCIMVDHWGSNNSLCDIGPTPLGDGIVDVEDLKVLAEHFFEDIDDPTLIAHWALDETEGTIAYDSAGVNDVVLVGNALWQPDSGQIDGALQLDGVNSYLVAGPVLNPADGPCSVFAWINGGAPGQVVLSQTDGANWLEVDAEGNLMTELMAPAVGRFTPQPLISECVITDGQWHRIGLVWDGSNRMLYVDDVVVAEDTQTNLQGSDNGLFIGTGKFMEPETYWSGLIDDVRIYNRAVKP